jgi:hypothetical protein
MSSPDREETGWRGGDHHIRNETDIARMFSAKEMAVRPEKALTPGAPAALLVLRLRAYLVNHHRITFRVLP